MKFFGSASAPSLTGVLASPRIAEAAMFAAEAHRGQFRKYTGLPYIHHPFAVARLVREARGSEAMAIAALLHDVVEDTPVTAAEVEAEFGTEVGDLVLALTNPWPSATGLPRQERKARNQQWLAQASAQAKTIKLADVIDNLDGLVGHDPVFARIYVPEKAALLEVLAEGDAALYARAQEAVRQSLRMLQALG